MKFPGFYCNGLSERASIMKNVVLISLGFTLLFTAFNSMATLQSSLNKDDGLGTASLATIYGALIVSCMFLPSLLIKKFTTKWTMVVCMLCYSAYIAAQFKPLYYTLIPTAIILGLGGAPMWSSKCKYLTQVGTRYAEITGQETEHVIVRFFGIFFLLFQSASVWGNIISSEVLGAGKNVSQSSIPYDKCGANYHPDDITLDAGNFEASEETVYTLAGIYLCCAVAGAVLVAFTVDPLGKFPGIVDDDDSLSGISLLVATFRHMAHPYQLLIIPLTLWSGFEQAFFGADFTAAYVTCSWDVSKIGYVLICYGVADAICSFMFGIIMKIIKRRWPVFLFGSLLNAGLIAGLFTWEPNPDEKAVYFVIAGLWGVADAIWQTQINAFYGVLFPNQEEAAFANYRLWESIGFVIAYIYANMLRVNVKLIVLSSVLGVAMVGYFVIEYMIANHDRLPQRIQKMVTPVTVEAPITSKPDSAVPNPDPPTYEESVSVKSPATIF